MQFEITSIRPAFMSRARTEGLDDQGQPVLRLVAAGGEPCRDVLRRALPGEELILASYCPFESAGPYREYGPVFILAQDAAEECVRTRLPTNAVGDAKAYLQDQFVLRAYNAKEEIEGAMMVTPDTAEEAISEMLSAEKTAFIHARFPTYGCFAVRIDRV